jgi:hypothetical protein
LGSTIRKPRRAKPEIGAHVLDASDDAVLQPLDELAKQGVTAVHERFHEEDTASLPAAMTRAALT